MRRRVLRHVPEQLAVRLLALVGAHRERLVDRLARLGRVPRVDDEGAVERVGCEGGRGASGQLECALSLYSTCTLRGGARGECCVVVCERERERGRTGTGKLGQDEDAVALLLARNVLVGDLRTSRRGTR